MTTIILGTHAIVVIEYAHIQGDVPHSRECDGKGNETITIKTTDTIELAWGDDDVWIQFPE